MAAEHVGGRGLVATCASTTFNDCCPCKCTSRYALSTG